MFLERDKPKGRAGRLIPASPKIYAHLPYVIELDDEVVRTRDNALMLSLEARAGSSCHGLAFRLAPGLADAESALLWRREMLRGIYRPQLLPVHTPQGEVRALVFAANPAHADHVGELPLADTAAIIARASGVLGSNRQYLEQLVRQLEHLGLSDDYLKQLLAHVRASA